MDASDPKFRMTQEDLKLLPQGNFVPKPERLDFPVPEPQPKK